VFLGACGDGLGTYEADSDGTYVNLNTNHEMRASLYGARFVTLDFSQGIDDTASAAQGAFSTSTARSS
jgi:hypothetical protein